MTVVPRRPVSASRALLTAILLALAATPSQATVSIAEAPYAGAFTFAFAAACVPLRQSYDGTAKTALALGWTEVGRDADPELDIMMGISEEAAKDPEAGGLHLGAAAPTMPPTGDTYSTFIPEVSQYKDQAGFSGPRAQILDVRAGRTPTE